MIKQCASYLLYITIFPPTQRLNARYIYYITLSVGQESGHSLVRCPASGTKKLQSRCQPGLRSHLLPTSHVCWQPFILVGCWTEGLSFLLALSQRLFLVPYPSGLLHKQLTTWQLASLKPAREIVSLQDWCQSYILQSYMYIYMIMCILSPLAPTTDQKQVIVLPTFRRRQLHKGMNTRGQGSQWHHKVCLPQLCIFFLALSIKMT